MTSRGGKDERPSIRLWETATQLLLGVHPHGGLGLAMAISPDGRQLAVAEREWKAKIWELADGLKLKRVLEQGEWCLSLD